MRPSNEGGAVLTGASASLLLQPSEFIESRKEAEAMLEVGPRGASGSGCGWKKRVNRRSLVGAG
jgi:hypothetical protein